MNKTQTIIIILLIFAAGVGVGLFSFQFLSSDSNTSENLSPVAIISIPISPELKAVQQDNAFTFHSATLYQFQADGTKNSDACLVMREWNIHKAYFSCGKEGQTVFALESEYRSATNQTQRVRAGGFRIPLDEGKYLNANFTSNNTIEIEPGVKYTYRVVFENFDLVPENFVVEYGDGYSGRLQFDLNKKTATYLTEN